jgi:capsular polysaccharide export protein
MAFHLHDEVKSKKSGLISGDSRRRDKPKLSISSNSSLELSDLPIYKDALLLQGPVGPFFLKLAHFLNRRGTSVHKVNFNPGDEYFYPSEQPNTVSYDFTPRYWPKYLERYIVQKQIGAIFIFGDCRPIHKNVKSLCKSYGIDLWVFEEGYYRPDFFTLEYFGVNANSKIFSTPIDSLLEPESFTANKTKVQQPICFAQSIHYMKLHAIMYWFHSITKPFRYSNYDHHRQLNLIAGFRWIKNFVAIQFFTIKDRPLVKRLILKASGDKNLYFLFPLQLHDDAQITHHSEFDSTEEVIELVVTSFYQYLSLDKHSEDVLIIKHHPMDCGQKNYSGFIKTLCKNLGITKHVYYLHDLDLDDFLPFCKGCVTINSTLGLKALDLGVPVKNLGRSFYDKPGITSQSSLDQFWCNPEPVYQQKVEAFRKYIIKSTQVNGCLYSPEYVLK